MKIEIKREPTIGVGTFGRVYVDGVLACQSLEDQVRELEGQPVEQWKVKDQTAIPRGRYRLTVEFSPRFHKDLPRLHGVPGFSGVLIHSGNFESDTSGCILVGTDRNEHGLTNSRLAFKELYADIVEALANGEECWVTIE